MATPATSYSVMGAYRRSSRLRQEMDNWSARRRPEFPIGPGPVYEMTLAEQDAARAERDRQSQLDIQRRQMAVAEDSQRLAREKFQEEMKAAEQAGRLEAGVTAAFGAKELGLWGKPAATVAPTATAALPATTLAAPGPLSTAGAYGAASAAPSLTIAGTTPTAATAITGTATAAPVAGTPAFFAPQAATTEAIAAEAAAAPAAAVSPAMGALGVGAAMFIGATLGGLFGGGSAKKYTSALGAGIATALAMTHTAGGAAIGSALGLSAAALGPIGFIVGGVAGFLFGGGSVICTELFAQGLITERQLRYCVIFRKKFVDDALYEGYLVWGSKVVKALQGTGMKKKLAVWFSIKFVEAIECIIRKKKMTVSQYIVAMLSYSMSRVCWIIRSRRIAQAEVV